MAEYIFPKGDGEEDIFIDGELLDNDSEFLKRAYAMKLMSLYVPSDYTDKRFEEITQGRAQAARKTNSFFSTCGELVMFLLYRMGYRGPILNRDLAKEDGGPRKYAYGQNMSRIFNTSKKEGVWVPFKQGMTPNPGDCCFVSNGPPRSEHVFVFKEHFVRDGSLYWRTYDAGQGGRVTQAAKVCERQVKGTRAGGKSCYGWINIDRIELTHSANLEVPVG